MNGEVTAVVMKKAIQVFKEQSVMGRYMVGSRGENNYCCVCLHFSSLSKQAKKWFGSCNREHGEHQALRHVGYGNQEDPLESAARAMASAEYSQWLCIIS